MIRKSLLLQAVLRFFEKPENVHKRNFRFFFVTNITYLFGLSIHLIFIFVFAGLHLYWMAAYNLVSCSVFFSSLTMNRQGRHNSSALLAGLEVIAHAGLSTWMIGWQSGFHYYIVVIVPLVYFVHSFRRWQQHSIVIFSSISYLAFYLYSVHYAPQKLLAPGILQALQMMNAGGMLIGLAFIAHYYSVVNRRTTASLIEESRELQRRNNEMEQDLQLARKIQMTLIPARSPLRNLAFYYKSMELVGGDFYDFIEFDDGERFGIFISDVSGHGVAAAFITSLIKGAILQVAHRFDHPSELLRHLNRTLYGQINNNFVTAFYGIYNISTRTFTYANAGHNAPFLFTGAGVNYLDCKYRTVPLAVLKNGETGCDFYDESISVTPGETLLLYTDGLTEAVPLSGDPVQFGCGPLTALLNSLSGEQPDKLVEGIVSGLLNYRGKAVYEDDVCLVCLQF